MGTLPGDSPAASVRPKIRARVAALILESRMKLSATGHGCRVHSVGYCEGYSAIPETTVAGLSPMTLLPAVLPSLSPTSKSSSKPDAVKSETANIKRDGIRESILAAERPRWADDEQTRCHRPGCRRRFLAVRKHHGRACGNIVCAPCAASRAPLPHVGDGGAPQRVCQTCIAFGVIIQSRLVCDLPVITIDDCIAARASTANEDAIDANAESAIEEGRNRRRRKKANVVNDAGNTGTADGSVWSAMGGVFLNSVKGSVKKKSAEPQLQSLEKGPLPPPSASQQYLDLYPKGACMTVTSCYPKRQGRINIYHSPSPETASAAPKRPLCPGIFASTSLWLVK